MKDIHQILRECELEAGEADAFDYGELLLEDREMKPARRRDTGSQGRPRKGKSRRWEYQG